MPLHRKLPDQNGWYWIEWSEFGDRWLMAYLDAECKKPRMMVIDQEEDCAVYNFKLDDERWREQDNDDNCNVSPERWIGPLSCPGGDFGSNIVEFTAELHEKAAAERKALALTCVDMRHCPGKHGSIIETVSLIDAEQAYKFGANWGDHQP